MTLSGSANREIEPRPRVSPAGAGFALGWLKDPVGVKSDNSMGPWSQEKKRDDIRKSNRNNGFGN